MKNTIIVILVLYSLLISLNSFAQTEISYGCDDIPSTSNSEISRVLVKSFNPSGNAVVDEIEFNVAENIDCFVYEEETLNVTSGIYYEFDAFYPSSRGFYQVLVDWNGDGIYDLNSNEVVARGETRESTISGSFINVDNNFEFDFSTRMRIMLSEGENGMQDENQARSVEIKILGDPPTVTISKTGSPDGRYAPPCVPFINYDQIPFSVYYVGAVGATTQFEVSQITIKPTSLGPSHTVVISNSSNEFFIKDKLTNPGAVSVFCSSSSTSNCNVVYGGQAFPITGSDEYQFYLDWTNIRNRLPILQGFPLNPEVYEIEVKMNVTQNNVLLNSVQETFSIGCCSNDEILYQNLTNITSEATYLPLYSGSFTYIEIVSPSDLIEVFANHQASLKAEQYIHFKNGFHAQKGSFVHAYIDDCELVDDLGEVDIISPISDLEKGNNPLFLEAMPNPFSKAISLVYTVPEAGLVHLKLYNVQGKYLNTLHKERQGVGTYQIEILQPHLPAGIYFALLQIGDKMSVLKIIKS